MRIVSGPIDNGTHELYSPDRRWEFPTQEDLITIIIDNQSLISKIVVQTLLLPKK